MIEGLCVAHIKITLNGERYCATRRLSPTGLPPRGASHRTAPDGLCGVTCDMGRVACLRQACLLVEPPTALRLTACAVLRATWVASPVSDRLVFSLPRWGVWDFKDDGRLGSSLVPDGWWGVFFTSLQTKLEVFRYKKRRSNCLVKNILYLCNRHYGNGDYLRCRYNEL